MSQAKAIEELRQALAECFEVLEVSSSLKLISGEHHHLERAISQLLSELPSELGKLPRTQALSVLAEKIVVSGLLGDLHFCKSLATCRQMRWDFALQLGQARGTYLAAINHPTGPPPPPNPTPRPDGPSRSAQTGRASDTRGSITFSYRVAVLILLSGCALGGLLVRVIGDGAERSQTPHDAPATPNADAAAPTGGPPSAQPAKSSAKTPEPAHAPATPAAPIKPAPESPKPAAGRQDVAGSSPGAKTPVAGASAGASSTPPAAISSGGSAAGAKDPVLEIVTSETKAAVARINTAKTPADLLAILTKGNENDGVHGNPRVARAANERLKKLIPLGATLSVSQCKDLNGLLPFVLIVADLDRYKLQACMRCLPVEDDNAGCGTGSRRVSVWHQTRCAPDHEYACEAYLRSQSPPSDAVEVLK